MPESYATTSPRLARGEVSSFKTRGLALLVALTLCACGGDEPKPDFTFFDACDPRQVPDEACYAAKRNPMSDNISLATDIAHRYIDEHPAADEPWDWTSGVLMFGLVELHRVTGDTKLRDYYKAWIDHHIAEGYGIVWSDSCPPALAALALYVESGDEAYKAVLDEVIVYLQEYANRTEHGGISHLGTLNVKTLWLDSLFMFGEVLTRWGEHTDDRDHLDMLGDQIKIFADLLQDSSGLMVHAWGWPLEHDTDIFWARGNSWVTASGADYLRARKLRHETDDDAEAIYLAQVGGILETQDPSGMWRTIMNRGDMTYLETSATALFAYGMARGWRYGIVGDNVRAPIDNAMTAVRSAITLDAMDRPIVGGISGPTGVGTFDDYATIPVVEDETYGVGAVILALIETSGLP